MGPLAILTCATLVLTAFHPGLAASLVIFSLSAAFGSYQIAANTAFVIRTPDERRAQALGIASMGVIVAQGTGFVAAGAATKVIAPATVVAIGGAAGAIAAAVLTLRWWRVPPPGGHHAHGRRLRSTDWLLSPTDAFGQAIRHSHSRHLCTGGPIRSAPQHVRGCRLGRQRTLGGRLILTPADL